MEASNGLPRKGRLTTDHTQEVNEREREARVGRARARRGEGVRDAQIKKCTALDTSLYEQAVTV